MDITKLMIGDWVWCGSNYGKVAEMFILHDSLLITVNNRRNKYFEEVNPFEVTTDAEDIRPIPLTQEILEKNFESESNIFGLQTYKLNENFNLEDRGDRFCLVRKCNDYSSSTFWICDLIHLHYLQHALELCGIEKEIIL